MGARLAIRRRQGGRQWLHRSRRHVAFTAGARPRRSRTPSARVAGARPPSPRRRCSASRARRRPARLLHARRRRRPRAGRAHRRAPRRAAKPCGPLAGVPVAVKDLICTRGLRTTFGSRLYADTCPRKTTWSSSACARAGAVIVGKTNTSEFGYGAFGHNAALPDHAQSLEPERHARRLERRLGARRWRRAWCRSRSAATAAARCAAGVAVRASSASSRRGDACRSTRVAATSAIRASRAGSRSSTSARSRAPWPTPRWRCRCWSGRRRATAHSLPDEIADWRVPAAETLRGVRIAFSPDLGYAAVDRRGARRRSSRRRSRLAAGARRQRSNGPTRRSATPSRRVRDAGRARHRPRRA